MTARKPLRVVSPGESAPAKPLTVTQAADSGDERQLLVAMRARIARTIEGDCPPRDLAALTRRLQDIAERIAALELAFKQEGAEGAISSTPDEEFDASAL